MIHFVEVMLRSLGALIVLESALALWPLAAPVGKAPHGMSLRPR